MFIPKLVFCLPVILCPVMPILECSFSNALIGLKPVAAFFKPLAESPVTLLPLPFAGKSYDSLIAISRLFFRNVGDGEKLASKTGLPITLDIFGTTVFISVSIALLDFFFYRTPPA